jgi:hypothetical protein
MKPMGLSCKNTGELVVVHLCLNCGKISRNRIAGDDNTYALLGLLEDQNGSSTTRYPEILTTKDIQQVHSALFGDVSI